MDDEKNNSRRSLFVSHGRGIDHVFLGSARDGKPERTGNGGNEG